jgi:uncharacterized repeat protein (TIGR03803 family)
LSAYGHAFGASENIRRSFNGTDGYEPKAGLIRDAKGNLYGTTQLGGADMEAGTVFELTAKGTESIHWNFCSEANCADGSEPEAGLIIDKDGNLYGTTLEGGTTAEGGASGEWGTVFALIPPSTSEGNWTESILWNFGDGTDGNTPLWAGCLMDKIATRVVRPIFAPEALTHHRAQRNI